MRDECIIKNTVTIISKRWTLLILISIYKGKNCIRRFSEIKKDLGAVTSKILSSRLKELETEGLLDKRVDNESVPQKCFYSLTEPGKDLINVVKVFKTWGLKWRMNEKYCKLTDCKDCRFE